MSKIITSEHLLSFIYYHPYLSSTDISVFINTKNVLTKLRQLQDKDFIDSIKYERTNYYFVTLKGFKLLAVEGSYRNIDIERRKFTLSHYIDTNKFFKILKIYADGNGIEFSDFVSDRFLNVKFSYSGKRYNINPDGFCIFKDKSFYIEMDRSTESSFKILEKVDAFSSFYLSFEYLKYFEKFPTVLFIVPTLKRKNLLTDRIKRFIDSNKYKDELQFFKVFVFDEFIDNPEILTY
ncbi:replication-relaxation family protein [Patescibacteria group bacterium]|nr:replication-relaxation family protein [Patescibacteria group bacterium]